MTLARGVQGVAVGWAVVAPLWLLTVAALALPVYSALVACAAFEFAVQSAERRNAARRPLAVRILATVMVTAVVMLGVSALGAACLLAAGPRALG